ncbi:hypothetical protein BH18ACI4_BH18ACI4_06600 [soil metagenome]
MSKSTIDEPAGTELTKALRSESVLGGRATLKHVTDGALDGSAGLRNACAAYLSNIAASGEDISVDTNAGRDLSEEPDPRPQDKVVKKRTSLKRKRKVLGMTPKPRFGLPEGFRASLQPYGRSVLLEENVYSLPSGQEFIPNYPTGTLGKLRHLYALLTVEQFESGRRGSVYIRTDGRVFDYSVDQLDSSRDMFDTGYTIYDLERTGRYAPKAGSKKKQNEDPKPRRLEHAG